MKKEGTKGLESQRLTLRKFTLEDASEMFENYCNDEEVCKYVTWKPHGTLEGTKEYLNTFVNDYNKENLFNWAIVLKETNQVIGAISIGNSTQTHSHGEFGWVVGKAWWGKGIVTEAAKLALEYLFTQGFETLSACYDVRNVASGKVMQKIGMTFDKFEKNAEKDHEGELFDKLWFKITKTQFENKHTNYDREYKLFLNAWGEEAQMRIAVEEMSELTKEVMKYIRFTKDVKSEDKKIEEIKQNLVSEVADVLNCVDNLAMMFGRKEVEKIRLQKIQRTQKKLKEEDKEGR